MVAEYFMTEISSLDAFSRFFNVVTIKSPAGSLKLVARMVSTSQAVYYMHKTVVSILTAVFILDCCYSVRLGHGNIETRTRSMLVLLLPKHPDGWVSMSCVCWRHLFCYSNLGILFPLLSGLDRYDTR